MATAKELKTRVKSLNNTKKITSAMKMVSASKLKKAKDASLKSKPYIEKIKEILARVQSSQEEFKNPLLEKREQKNSLFLLFSSDRGLCGAFNNSLFKFFNEKKSIANNNFDVLVVGKKAKDYINRFNIKPIKFYEGVAAKPTFIEASQISSFAMNDFLEKKYDYIYVVYNHFVSTLSQKPTLLQLLPIISEEKDEANKPLDYIYEPDKNKIIDHLLPKQISLQVFQCMLDNAAGEHAARMTAMESSTKNAKDLIKTLTLKMNRARQAAITTELIEVVAGASL